MFDEDRNVTLTLTDSEAAGARQGGSRGAQQGEGVKEEVGQGSRGGSGGLRGGRGGGDGGAAPPGPSGEAGARTGPAAARPGARYP